MTFDGRTLTTLVMFSIFAGASLLALGLPQKAAFMPMLIGIPGALLCFAQLVMDLWRKPSEPEAADDEDDATAGDEGTARSEAEVFMWFGIFCVALIGFGFTWGGPIVVAAFVRFFSHEDWRTASFAGAGTLAVTYGVFVWLLELSLFQGLVLEALF